MENTDELTRLQSELAEARAENERLKADKRADYHDIMVQRDAAIAEIERLKGQQEPSIWTVDHPDATYYYSLSEAKQAAFDYNAELIPFYTAPPDLAAKVAELTQKHEVACQTISQLQKHRDTLQGSLSRAMEANSNDAARISELTEQVKVAQEALEYYARDIGQDGNWARVALAKLQGAE